MQAPGQLTRPAPLQVQALVPMPPPPVMQVSSQVKPAVHIALTMQTFSRRHPTGGPASVPGAVQAPGQLTRPAPLQVQALVPMPPPPVMQVSLQVKPAVHIALAMHMFIPPASAGGPASATGHVAQLTRPAAATGARHRPAGGTGPIARKSGCAGRGGAQVVIPASAAVSCRPRP